eukprot:8194518-Lingulodinium_polyedra.AAC.1
MCIRDRAPAARAAARRLPSRPRGGHQPTAGARGAPRLPAICGPHEARPAPPRRGCAGKPRHRQTGPRGAGATRAEQRALAPPRWPP